MRRLLFALPGAVLAAVTLANAGVAARVDATPADRAIAACQAKRLVGGTPEFQACVQSLLGQGGGQPAPGGGQQTPGGGQQTPGGGQQTPSGGQQTPGGGQPAQGGATRPATATTLTAKGATPQQQAQMDACTAKGLAVLSDAWKACLNVRTGPGKAGSGGPTDAQLAAQKACTAKGFAAMSGDWKACVLSLAPAAPAGPDPGAQLTGTAKVAYDGCRAKDLAVGSAGFNACIADAMKSAQQAQQPAGNGAGASGTKPTAEQQAALDSCKSQGFTPGSDAQRKCVEALLPKSGGGRQGGADGGQRPSAAAIQAATQAATKACTAKGYAAGSSKLKQCVNGLLALADAMAACAASGLKDGSDAWKKCVKARLAGTEG